MVSDVAAVNRADVTIHGEPGSEAPADDTAPLAFDSAPGQPA
jgi:hypothetical protein